MLSWICIGDFNEILEQDEKKGKLEKRWSHIYDFRKPIDEVGLRAERVELVCLLKKVSIIMYQI